MPKFSGGQHTLAPANYSPNEGGDHINPLKIMAWAVDTKLPQAQKLVLLLLAHYSDKDMTCYPGQTRLADQAGMSDRNVRRAVSELEAKGLIYRQKRFRKDGTRTSDLYHLNVGSQPVDNSYTTGQIVR